MAIVNVLKATAQNFTASWVDYGIEISTDGFDNMSIWLDIDINSTVDARVRILAKHTTGGDEYSHPIETVSASVISVQDEYFEFETDVDEKRVLLINLDGIIPYVQVQIEAGTVGGTAGKILDSKYILK